MRAALFLGPDRPLGVEDVSIDSPMDREVLVRTVFSSLCHTDYHYIEGRIPMSRYGLVPPVLLGHEAAGVVEAVGRSVSYVQPGDHVVCHPNAACGQCRMCVTGRSVLCISAAVKRRPNDRPKLLRGKEPVGQHLNVGGYAEMLLVHESSLVKIPQAMPLDAAALLGCGIMTGVGAVVNTAKVEAGSTVAIFGCGGSGLAAVQGANLSGAQMVIAVDITDDKLLTARQLGATHSVNAKLVDPVEAVLALTEGGADYCFEFIGSSATARQAVQSTGRGGTVVMVGLLAAGETVAIDGSFLLGERRLLGCATGSNRARHDIPRYIELYLHGRLKLDEMISRKLALSEINEGFRSLAAHEVSRVIVAFD